MVSLRSATVDDLPAVTALDTASFHEGYPLSVLRQFLDITGDLFVVAEAAGEIVGYALGGLGPRPTVGWLLSAAVIAHAQGRGIGGMLGTEVARRLDERGVEEIFLTVRPDNEPMIRWCRSAEFLCVGDDPHYFGAGERRLIMRSQRRR